MKRTRQDVLRAIRICVAPYVGPVAILLGAFLLQAICVGKP